MRLLKILSLFFICFCLCPLFFSCKNKKSGSRSWIGKIIDDNKENSLIEPNVQVIFKQSAASTSESYGIIDSPVLDTSGQRAGRDFLVGNSMKLKYNFELVEDDNFMEKTRKWAKNNFTTERESDYKIKIVFLIPKDVDMNVLSYNGIEFPYGEKLITNDTGERFFTFIIDGQNRQNGFVEYNVIPYETGTYPITISCFKMPNKDKNIEIELPKSKYRYTFQVI